MNAAGPWRATLDGAGIRIDGPTRARVPWWSFGKTVIAATVLALARDGRLALDDALPGAGASIRSVLAHRGGLGDYGALPEYHRAVARGDPPWTLEEVRARLGDRWRSGPPETGFAYSNVGYRLLADHVGDVAGCPAVEAARRLVLDPLGVEDVAAPATPADLAAACDVDMGGYHPGWVLHGLLTGRLGDAAKVLAGILGGLLPPDLAAAMTAGHAVGGPVEGRPFADPRYGLGLMVDPVLGCAGHTGGGPGSAIAVYARGGVVTAAFAAGADAGAVERIALGLA